MRAGLVAATLSQTGPPRTLNLLVTSALADWAIVVRLRRPKAYRWKFAGVQESCHSMFLTSGGPFARMCLAVQREIGVRFLWAVNTPS